jgi:hypothetical protein
MFENIARQTLANGGATFDSKGEAIMTGWSIGGITPAQTVPVEEFTPNTLAAILTLFVGSGTYGTWIGPKSKTDPKRVVWIEPVTILPTEDRDGAVALGASRGEQAVFHLDTFEEVDTGGNGTAA